MIGLRDSCGREVWDLEVNDTGELLAARYFDGSQVPPDQLGWIEDMVLRAWGREYERKNT